jgi:Flp pilus assembly CpaF family ATPase
VGGPALTIRKFTRRYRLDDLIEIGALTPAVAATLVEAIGRHQNVLISGGTGTGKTTLLNVLTARIPDEDRIVVIEETAEIHLDKPNLLRFEARRAQIPLGRRCPCRRGRSPICSVRHFVIDRIASWSARSEALRRSTCCRR